MPRCRPKYGVQASRQQHIRITTVTLLTSTTTYVHKSEFFFIFASFFFFFFFFDYETLFVYCNYLLCLFYFVLFMKKSWFYLCVVCWMQIQCYYELLLFINSCEISNFSSFVLPYYVFKLEPLRPYAMLLNILYS